MLAEFVLSIIGEAIAELGFYSLSKRPNVNFWNRSIAVVWYVILGFALGAASLWFVPLMIFRNRTIPIAFFVVSPVLAGLGLCFANWIIKRGIDDESFFQLRKFIYGAMFALTFSVTRSMFG